MTITLQATNISSPKLLISRCTTIIASEKIAWVRPEGTPSRMMRPI